MKFIPNTNNQYKFNEKGEVFSLKKNRFLISNTDAYSIICINGRINMRKEALQNLYKFLELDTKPIPNFSNYHITKDGNVYSLVTNCWIKPFYDKDGYKRLALVNDNKIRIKQRVCRLVALTYIENPNNYPIVNHINEIKCDDNVDNLEWCTFSYNTLYSKSWLKRDRNKNGTFV